ncbi:MAG: Trimeric GatFAB AmidoTransferase(AdT) complex subunit, partial [Pleopsidium flavum]
MSLLAKAERCLLNQVHSGSRVNAFIPSKKRGIIKDLEDANARREEGRHVSNLDGSLMAIKDNICTEQYATSCGSEILKAFTSPYDATVVTKLRAAGAIIAGKTNLDEFGMGSHSTHSCFGPVRNFVKGVKNDISAGGSSGGSAIAVATGQCNAALGTDTGGSVRLPAAYCGIVGFKPSYGLVSRWGVVAYANSLDTVGVLANDSHDAKKVFDTINDYDVRDPTSLSQTSRSRLAALLSRRERQRPLRIGVPVEYNIQELSAMVRDAWLCTIHHLQRLGHSVHQVSLPATKHALSAYYVLAPAEASSNLAKYDGVRYGIRNDDKDGIGGVLYANTRGKGFGDEVKRRILLGAYSLSAEAIDNYFLKAQKVRRLVQQDFNDVFAMPNPLLDVPDAHSELEGVD